MPSNRSIAVGMFFAAVLLLGLHTFDDYGLGWDEPAQRGHGLVSFDYVNARLGNVWGDERLAPEHELGSYPGRNYGVAFQLVNLVLERSLPLETTREFYLLRHLTNFLLFWTGCWFFFRILELRFGDWRLPLLGTLMLILSPRIFAHAHFNPKDLVLLPLYVIACFTLLRFIEARNLRWAFLHGMTSALVINARITGLIVPAITLGIFLLGIVGDLSDRQKPWSWLEFKSRIGDLVMVAVYLVAVTAASVLIWPTLWESPWESFRAVFTDMNQYGWDGELIYFGEWMKAADIPWHYPLGWMALTTPAAYIVLALVGLVGVVVAGARCLTPDCWRRIIEDGPLRTDLICTSLFLGPLIVVIALRSNLYDGWRHLYFVYPFLIYLSCLAINGWVKARRRSEREWSKWGWRLAVVGLVFSMASTGWNMVINHPFQYVYFNHWAADKVADRFDQELWGLSSRHLLEHLVRLDPGDELKVYAEIQPTKDNMIWLSEADRERITFTAFSQATYFISHHRLKNDFQRFFLRSYPYDRPLHEITVDGRVIGGIYSLR